MCIANWLLGIGDRHLSNILVSLKDGQCVGIDFGLSFGAATQFLSVPELMPFRLTPHIVNLLQPMEETGALTYLIFCIKCFLFFFKWYSYMSHNTNNISQILIFSLYKQGL